MESTVSELEKILGVKLDVDVKNSVKNSVSQHEIDFEIDDSGSLISIYLPDSAGWKDGGYTHRQ